MDDRKIYAFDWFRLDPRGRRLTHAGHPVALAPKVLDTLIVLIQNAGRLLSKQELHRHLWPDTFVEDVTLARSISDLRTALGVYSESKYIETLPKHGYRFVSEIDVTAYPGPAADLRASDIPPSSRRGLIIAVLPFAPLGDDNSVQIFGDGLAEEIVHALSRIRGLMVAACGSSFQFRGGTFDFRRIAAELGTELILHGTVRKSGSSFHVTVQLIETNRFTIRWSEHYQKESADLFDLQNLIAKVIVSELKPELNGADLQIRPLRHSNQTEAWHALWEGRLHQHRFTPEGLAHAERCFEKALAAQRVIEPGLVHHSNRGSQYASGEYTDPLQKNGIAISMSRKGNPWDNAACESFMKTLKYEEVHRNEYRDLNEARFAIRVFLEKVYNQKRLHSAIGYVPPAEFEANLRAQQKEAATRQLAG